MTISLGTRIKTVRVLRGYDQREFSIVAGISRPYLSYIESDRLVPTDGMLKKIEAAFGLDLTSPEVEAAFGVLGGNGHATPLKPPC